MTVLAFHHPDQGETIVLSVCDHLVNVVFGPKMKYFGLFSQKICLSSIFYRFIFEHTFLLGLVGS
jgi:hypothetical protein